MAKSFEEWRKASTEELIREYDRLAKGAEINLRFVREELAHRVLESHSEVMVTLTRRITLLTVIIAILTAANVLLVAWQVTRHL